MKGIKILALAAAGLATLASVTAISAATMMPCGVYIEGNIGASNSSHKTYGTGTSVGGTSGLAWNVNGGYRFVPFFAVEGGVTSYANSNVKNSGGTQFEVDRHWGYDIAAKGIIPIADSGFEAFGKIGAVRLYSSTRISNQAAVPAGINPIKNSSTSLYLGLGVDFAVLPTLAANLQWQRAQGNSSTGYQDLVTVGLTWRIY